MVSVGRSIAAVFAAAALLLPAAGWSQSVGTAAAVKPSSTGTPPGGALRTLEIGAQIVSNERIRTTGSGSLQVMFIDKTTLTVGPNSDLVIDTFVYSPNASGGQFAASLATGALRFVGGAISHTTGATINTPVATIAVRGGAMLVTLDAVCQRGNPGGNPNSKCAQVLCTIGLCDVKVLTDSRNIQLKIGQAVEIGGLGIAQPIDVSSAKLNDLFRGGVSGGQGNQNQNSGTGQGGANSPFGLQQAPEPIAPTPQPGPGP